MRLGQKVHCVYYAVMPLACSGMVFVVKPEMLVHADAQNFTPFQIVCMILLILSLGCVYTLYAALNQPLVFVLWESSITATILSGSKCH